MDTDRRIGRVVKVKTYQVLVELLPDTTSYVKSSHGGLYAIAVVNSYVIMPIGSERVVGLVTGLDMAEEQEAHLQNRQMLVLPQSRRTMWVSMVGTISQAPGGTQRIFDFGIRRYPELDNPVWFASEEDLDVIFEKDCPDKERSARLVTIGKSPLFPDYDVKIDMDRFFGKHAAVLGNTGSGKSCTVTALIRSVMDLKAGNGMPHAHFIIFDTNAEYEAAFTIEDPENSSRQFLYNRYVISNETDEPSGFWLPHWFMNGRDFTAFFRPGEGAQGPLLHRAIEVARSRMQGQSSKLLILVTIEDSINSIASILENPPSGNAVAYGRKNLRDMIDPLMNLIEGREEEFNQCGIGESYPVYKSALGTMASIVGTDNGVIQAEISHGLRPQIDLIREQLTKDQKPQDDTSEIPIGVDTPVFFDFEEFVSKTIRQEIEREADRNSNIRNWVGTLLMRLEQARNDPRYSFLFKVRYFQNPLASFLRLLFGVNPSNNYNEADSRPPWKDVSEEQYPDPKAIHQVTILDFSRLASDVLENVTALLGRLILEFMQRCPRRALYPVVLVLEEAHHYIPAEATLERQQRAREVFERIAKEGRKYGLSLIVASQRPSELSRTVLAQCNSFIVHRIQNPDDQAYFRAVISGINRELLDQLPALPQQHALVLGDCIKIPLQVRINNVDPRPQSHDPQFFKIWSDSSTQPPDFEAIASKWEGAGSQETGPTAVPVSAAPASDESVSDNTHDDDLPF